MGDFLLEQVAICCWRGHLRVCFNISHFLLTRMQFSTWTRFPIARCRTRTERSVSVGRYQTETRWCSFFVKSHVGALSLEPSDISMLHNSHNRCTLLCHHYSPTHLSTALPHSHESRARLQTSGDSNCLILIQSCRGFSEVKHCTGPYLWTLPAAFEPGSWKFRYCSFSKVITTTSFMNFSGIQRWRYHHHKLATTSTSPPAENPNIDISGGDSWIITVTAEHGATCTNSKMRPEDSLMAYASWLEVLLHLFGLQKARTATNVCFHLLSLSDKSLSPRKAQHSFEKKPLKL